LEILKSRLGQKRARLPDATEEEDDDDEESLSDWDLADHRREATRVQNRRAIELGSRENVKELRRVQNGYVDHPRLGLIGCLAYWARGSMAHTVTMIVALCVKLGISGGGPWRCQVVHALNSQCGRRATLLWSQK